MRSSVLALCLVTACVNLTPPGEMREAGTGETHAPGPNADTGTADAPAPVMDKGVAEVPLVDTPTAEAPPGGPDTPGLAAAGTACSDPASCASGFCVNGVCCLSACGQCQACNVPGSLGSCSPAPAGQDPRNECPAEAPETCGRSGGCDGNGACRLHPAGTPCAAASCTGATETAARSCNGSGVCTAGTTRTCGSYLCGPTACRTSCASTAECKSGLECVSGACLGPILHWRFDETSGTSALDSSGNGYNGTYGGATGTPTTSSNVAPLKFTNPASRAFSAAQRTVVRLMNPPQALMPANSVTVSAWFRTQSIPTGSYPLILSMNGGYFITLAPGILWQARGVTANNWDYCSANISGLADGQWHHVAGVWAPSGMKLYYDGVERCTNTSGQTLAYATTLDFRVGQRTPTDASYQFDGNIDDVRIYNRVLTATQIQNLYNGME